MNKTETLKKRIFLSPPHMGGAELGCIEEAFASNCIAPLGPMVDRFEKIFSEYLDIPYCVALSSGTAAMHLVLKHLIQVSGLRFRIPARSSSRQR